MSEQDINNLLAGNAPKAERRKRVKDDDAFWERLEDGSRKYSARSYTLNDPNANAEAYGTVLEIETMEVEELRESYDERRAKPFETCKRLPKIDALGCPRNARSDAPRYH
jgi:hypothetical protein